MPSKKGKESDAPFTRTITISSDKVAKERDDEFEALNSDIALVRLNGRVRFVYRLDRQFHFYSKQDLQTLLANRYVPTAKGGRMPAFEYWLTHPDRREYSGVMFEPDPKKAAQRPYALNLFRGFAVKPKEKERGCELFYAHLLHNVCNGDLKHYRYLLDTFASWFQRPGVKIPAPVLVGEKGSGKSVVGNVMRHLVGVDYGILVDKTEQLTGRFNSQFVKALVVQIEEAVFARDLKSQSTIKHLLTCDRLRIEMKGVDAFEMESKFNCIFTSNASTVVNATGGERRYFCLEVGNGNMQDAPYFVAMREQLEDGGYEALLFDLLARDISRTNFATPPHTSLLSRQIVEGFGGLERWWSEVLAAGELTFARQPEFSGSDLHWPDVEGEGGRWDVPKAAILASAADGARDHTGRAASPEAVGRFLSAELPGLTASRPRGRDGSRLHVYHLPPLEACREAFVARRPGLLLEDVKEGVRVVDGPEEVQQDGVVDRPPVRFDAWAARIPVAQRPGGNVVRMPRRA